MEGTARGESPACEAGVVGPCGAWLAGAPPSGNNGTVGPFSGPARVGRVPVQLRKHSLMKTRLFAAVLAALGTCAAAAGQARTWTDAAGQEQVEAVLIDYNGGRVWLRRAGGGNFGVRPDELSLADQQFVREEIRRRDESVQPRPSADGDVRYAPGRELCKLANQAVRESSGIARSLRAPGLFWTHNDSDDDARIYLFDPKGKDLGSCTLSGVRAYDWEDMISVRLEGKDYLVVCDTGNNGRASAVQMLYVVEEPAIDPDRGVTVAEVPVAQTIYFSYEDDHRDCEAVACDPTEKTFYLATKERGEPAYVYRLPWPAHDPKRRTAHVARQIARLKVREVTSMDISPDGRRAVVVNYRHAYEYTRGEKEDWAAAFARPPRLVPVPERAQGESVCFGADGKTLYLTSERLPTPLFEVPGK